MDEQEKMNLWIAQYLNNELPEDQVKTVEEWIIAHPDEFDFIQSAFDHDDLQFDTPKAWEKTVGRWLARRNKRRKVLLFRFSMAASLLLLLGWGVTLFWGNTEKREIGELSAHFLVAKDSTTTYLLPDGTKVKLFKKSVLSYQDWTGAAQRLTKLKGKAYFEVTKDAKHPFIIETNRVDVQVYGTSFIVDTQHAKDQSLVWVKEGLVGVTQRSSGQTLKLGRDECLLSDKEGLKRYTAYDRNQFGWATAEWRFTNASLADVVRTLEAHFGETITLNGDGGGCLVTATFEHQSLDAILNELQLILNFKYTKSAKGYTLYELTCH